MRNIGLSIIISGLFLTQCGYHIYEREPSSKTLYTISVPYFAQDRDGMLTDAIIKQLSTSSFEYRNEGGTLIVKGEVVEDSCVDIGYKYDRQPVSKEIIRRLVPNEGRRTITARISLLDSHSQKVIYGPFDLSASGDYDFFDLNSSSFIGNRGELQSALFFSLGQLDSAQGAHETSRLSIYENLASKIVEAISHLLYKRS